MTGQIAASQIADAAVTTAKFAASIKPIEIVSVLPTTGNTQGRTVFLTTDNKLYRYNGTAFVSTVPTGDLTGQITTTQITDDAITTAKIAANAITATELAASSVVAGKIAAAAVSTTELAAGAITAAKIATGTITANEIAASTITGAKIAADTITTANVAANAITATELAASSVVSGKIAAAAISTTELAAGAVTAAKIATGTITANEIAASTITGGKIAADTITGANIAANTITATELAANSVVAGKIAAAAVSTTELAANAVTADRIEANALRGKTLSGGVVIDGGSVVTTAVAKPADITVEVTVAVQSTEDFFDWGAAIVLSKNSRFLEERQFRYTGKTATTLTGVSGLQYALQVGDIVVPQPFPSFTLDSYAGASTIDTSAGANFLFRKTGGTALAICGNRVTDVFTYTAGQRLSGGVYVSELTGVSGLASFSLAQGSRATIVDITSLAYCYIPSTGAYTSITVTPLSYLKSTGGKCLFVREGATGIKKVTYASLSGTTLTFDSSVTLSIGWHLILPLYSFNVVGSDLFSIVNYNNSYNGEWQKSYISSDVEVSTSANEGMEITPSVGYGLKVWPSAKASELDTAGIFVGEPGGALHLEFQPINYSSINESWMYGGFYGSFFLGAAKSVGSYADNVLVGYDGSTLNQYQPISTTLRFNGYNATNLDGIVFDDTTDVFSLWADGVAGKGQLSARNITLTQPPDQYPVNISIPKPSHATSKRTAVSIGDFLIGEDTWGDGTRDFFIFDWVANGIRFVVGNTGNVGIGTRTPTWPLTVVGDIRTEGAGNIFVTGTGQVGYGAGAGGTVTQTGSRTTAVTLNKATGRITLVLANGTATPTTFVVNNSIVNALDNVIISQRTGSNKYAVFVTGIAAGSFDVTFYSVSGTAAESPQFSFTVIKGQTA